MEFTTFKVFKTFKTGICYLIFLVDTVDINNSAYVCFQGIFQNFHNEGDISHLAHADDSVAPD